MAEITCKLSKDAGIAVIHEKRGTALAVQFPKQRSGSTTYALYLVMVLYALSGLLVLVTVHAARSRAAHRDLNTSRSVSA